jgi:uncharacterized protein (DUF58 family)
MPAPLPTTSAPLRRGGGSVDAKALMAIRSLELRARVVVEGFWHGLHRSPYHGFSVEFTEYRQYSPGDDTRYLDWRLYARSDRYHLKKYEDETNLRCHLLVDQSRSMGYGTAGHTKADYARTLAATLAWILTAQGVAAALFAFAASVRGYLPARHRHGHLRQLMLVLEKEPEGAATSLGEPLRRVAELARKRGLLILISDLLAPIDELERNLRRLSAAGHDLVVFQVLDPNELAFDFAAALQFQDVESRREIYLDPEVIRAEYQRKLERHGQEVAAICHKLGFSFHRVVTDQPLDLALHDFLRVRNRRGKRIRRRVQATAPS